MHTQLELDRHTVVDLHLTDYRGDTPQCDEREVLASRLQKDRCYVLDRGYFKYELFNAIVNHGSDYVCRVKKSISGRVIEGRTARLSGEAKEAGVVRDVVMRAGCCGANTADHPLRLITVETEVDRRDQIGTTQKEQLLIATNLLDVPAEIIALLYRYRWTIELFFRFFKQLLGCRHLISDDPRGIAIQCYCAVIACMLLTLYSGKKPNISTWRMVNWYLSGWASETELMAHLSKPPPDTGIRQRQKDELWKKLGY
jgi:IS4 transposase